MSFRIVGLNPSKFEHLFGLGEAELRSYGVLRYVVDEKPGFPDRVGMRDLEPGETALLLNFTHQAADNPYRASHAIFVREGAQAAYDHVGKIPEVLRVRMLSLRGFSSDHMMRDADLTDGREIEAVIERLFADGEIEYIHVHAAKRGCYLGRIERA